MSGKPLFDLHSTKSIWRAIRQRVKHALTHRWGMKLACVAISLVIWGGLISQDAGLTREKSFRDVQVTAANAEILQRNGLIVVDGLDDLPLVQMRASVPQRNFPTVTPNNYNVRVDLSKITGPGEQMLPIITSSTLPYGQVTWLSKTEVMVRVDEYVTRRRIPVQLDSHSMAPAGFYAAAPSLDPAMVVVSGPKQLVDSVVRCVAIYDVSRLAPQAGAQLTAVPFALQNVEGQPIASKQITVTSESILLDTVLVEQVLYPMKTVDLHNGVVTQGKPAPGYEVRSITLTPSYLSIAGTADFLKSLQQLEALGTVDLTGAKEPLVRAVKVERPVNAQFISEDAVYVTIDIQPIGAPSAPTQAP